jgi:hypothetical protein
MTQEDKPSGITFMVQGIVAARNSMPYVLIENENGRIAQLTIAEARNVALDLLRAASYAETDAMLVRFFKKHDLPEGGLAAVLMDFRDFRFELDREEVLTSYGKSDT